MLGPPGHKKQACSATRRAQPQRSTVQVLPSPTGGRSAQPQSSRGARPPVPQKPRSLRAYHAVASLATSTRSLDARSPSAMWAQKRVSPHRVFGLGRGKAPPPRRGKGQKRTPAPGSVRAQPHKGLSPKAPARCKLPPSQTLLLFSGSVRGFTSVTLCSTPGAGLRLWPGVTPPDVRLCARLLPLLREGAFPWLSSRARRGLTRPPCVGGRGAPGVQRPHKNGRGDHHAERARGPSARGDAPREDCG